MTEKGKVELNQLLNEALEELQIGVRSKVNSLLLSPTVDSDSSVFEVYFGNASLPLSQVKLRDYLQQRWGSYGIDSSSDIMDLQFYIANEATKSKLLEFIRRELEPFIDEEKDNSPYSTSYAITGEKDGFRLHTIRSGVLGLPYLLEHLLKIAVTYGVEKAVSIFDEGSSVKGKRGFYQDIVSLEGIVVEEEIQVCEGVKLVPFPQSATSEFESYFPGSSIRNSRFARQTNMGKTLLIIDCPLLSIFQKTYEDSFDEMLIDDLPFPIETDNIKFSNPDEVDSFREFFCQALSLACNSPVQIALKWWFLAEDDLFHPFPGGGMSYSPQLFRDSVKAGQSEIDKAKRIFDDFAKLNSDDKEKLLIAVERWIKSKTSRADTDRMIDLGVALESLYVPDSMSESTFKLGVRAAWHLREDPAKRKDMKKKFGEIYDWRSKAVHTGKLPKKTKNLSQEEINEFIGTAQDYCRHSILKILKEGKFPANWDDLIFG